MDELPKEFDLIVIGTGLSESCVAAAASRIGKTVLHLDQNEFYGGQWASFNLLSLELFLNNVENTKNNIGISAIKQFWSIEEANTDIEETENSWTKEKIIQNSRKFNIDLVPKLLFSNGKLVDLLISSNICRYAEFRSVDKVCTLKNGYLQNVPCSRTDIFNTKSLTIVEKRILMKFLNTCLNYDKESEEFIEFQDKTFVDYLKSTKLTDNIIHSVVNAITMCDNDMMIDEAMGKTKAFLNSLGRFGNTPFLFPMYGCGEIPQCFCRLCAVFGGTYCLKKSIDDITVADETIILKTSEQTISAKNLVISSSDIQDKIIESGNKINNSCGEIARAIFICSVPMGDEELNSGGGGVNVLKRPGPNGGAFIIQLSHYSGTCPKGLYIIHITAKAVSASPEEDLSQYTAKLFDLGVNPLYAAYFLIPKCKGCEGIEFANRNIYSTCGPHFELDYDKSIENAKKIFSEIYPNDLFLPRAPDPEEIILGDEDPSVVSDCNLTTELREQMSLEENSN